MIGDLSRDGMPDEALAALTREQAESNEYAREVDGRIAQHDRISAVLDSGQPVATAFDRDEPSEHITDSRDGATGSRPRFRGDPGPRTSGRCDSPVPKTEPSCAAGRWPPMTAVKPCRTLPVSTWRRRWKRTPTRSRSWPGT